MTIQIRAKRRLLPKRSIVDIDYISPTQNVQDLLFTATPSKKDHGVISELHGKETKDQEQLPQVALDVNDNAAQFVSGITIDETVVDMAMDEDAVVKDSIIKHVIVKDATVEDAVVIEKNDSTEHYMSTRVDSDQSETSTLNHKKLVTEGNQSSNVCSLEVDDEEEEKEPVVVIEIKKKKRREDESFMLPPNKLPKKIRSHETIHALKYSGALDWIINGKDTDPRKHDIGKVRKRQLEKRLHRPLAAKGIIQNRPQFIIQ
ncbi:unnamed protein product [Rhizopus stolonifer]